MKYWIFQGNPDHFQAVKYIEEHEFINWTVRQKHFTNEMQAGDEVYLWQAAGSKGSIAGIIATANIIAEPAELPEDPVALPYWNEIAAPKKELRVRLRIKRRCLGRKEIVQSKWLIHDPVLKDLLILRMAQNTNYKISASEAQRLSLLTRNTGRDWTREECLAALWAYSETEGKSISELPGSPVATVAVTIGRAVGGVYNKVMNFRSIDPRDIRAGLSSTNQIDHQVWKEFYDTSLQTLKKQEIDGKYRRLWNNSQGVENIVPVKVYKYFGEAPDDDLTQLQAFARKVRKGQDKFRKNLLKLYGGRCAVSGWSPEAVLEAAHISEHAKSGINHSGNGILLRSDFHNLLDANLLQIDPETCTICLDPSLKETPYWEYQGAQLNKRVDGSQIGHEYLLERFASTSLE